MKRLIWNIILFFGFFFFLIEGINFSTGRKKLNKLDAAMNSFLLAVIVLATILGQILSY